MPTDEVIINCISDLIESVYFERTFGFFFCQLLNTRNNMSSVIINIKEWGDFLWVRMRVSVREPRNTLLSVIHDPCE